jgi:hypothetical protein
MFAIYNYNNFPEVIVSFHGSINNEIDFLSFINSWKALYNDKRYFIFIFDMKEIGFVNPIYCFKMASFISGLKSEKPQYLLKSKIINVNKFMNILLRITFNIQSPIAPVEVHNNDGSILLVPV